MHQYRLFALFGVASLSATMSWAQTVIVKGTADPIVPVLGNGSFESFTLTNNIFGTPPTENANLVNEWEAYPFDNPTIQQPTTNDPITRFYFSSNANAATDGSRSAIIGVENTLSGGVPRNLGVAGAYNTGYSIQAGNAFDLSFDYLGLLNWDGLSATLPDSISWDLFYTEDDTLRGTKTIIDSGEVFPSPSSVANAALDYSTFVGTSLPAPVDAAGRQLWLGFRPSGGAGFSGDLTSAPQNEFARIDSVDLSIGGSPLITGNTAPYNPNYVLNGSFETTETVGTNAAAVAGWTAVPFSNTGLDESAQFITQSAASNPSDGARSAVIGLNTTESINTPPNTGVSLGLNTGFTLSPGDVLTLSFDHRGALNWDEGDEIDWRLFYTSDNTIDGMATDVAAGSVAPTLGIYNSTGVLVSSPVSAAAAGKTLFVAFTPGEGTGEDLGAALGDYNSDGVVNLADYTVWRDSLGAPAGTLLNDETGEAIGASQYDIWKANFGGTGGPVLQDEFARIDQVNLTVGSTVLLAATQIPEPTSAVLLVALVCLPVVWRVGQPR